MTSAVTAPSKGSALQASWGAAVSAAIADLTPMASAGGLSRSGVTGCGLQPAPQNRRAADVLDFDGPFALYAEFGSDGKVSAWRLRNCVWNVGGVTHENADDPAVEDEIDSEGDGGFLYVKFPCSDSATYDEVKAHFAADLDALHKEQLRYDQYCVPLYRFKFTHDESSSADSSSDAEPSLEIVDLRRAPQVQSFESGLEFGGGDESNETEAAS